MRYERYDTLDGKPNVVVDGTATGGTLLTLSHWEGSGTPPELADDLSTQIVFRYLDRPDLHVQAEAVSNNHFDQDGLCGIYALVDPEAALSHRALLEDIAGAGDFGTYTDRAAVRIAFALGAYADPERSPADPATFGLPYPAQCAALYQETLARLPEMLGDPGRFATLWEPDDAALARDEARLAGGGIELEELPEIDLTIVTVRDGGGDPHEVAINNATARHRVLTIRPGASNLRYRYETWVTFVSAPTAPRVDLAPLAAELDAMESGGASWTFDGVDDLTPALRPAGAESTIDPQALRDAVIGFLRRA